MLENLYELKNAIGDDITNSIFKIDVSVKLLENELFLIWNKYISQPTVLNNCYFYFKSLGTNDKFSWNINVVPKEQIKTELIEVIQSSFN